MSRSNLLEAYNILLDHFGPQGWWPGETPFEVMVGAILTQNTNWRNVEKAICNLRERSFLEPRTIHEMTHSELAFLIRPAGYHNIKAKRLKNFVREFLDKFSGSLDGLKELDLERAREWLLSVNGIGQETADSMLLYALDKPIFVVDAYTKRILERHGLAPEEVSYAELQELFMDNLEHDAKLFNEYHALIVRVGKEYCKKIPKCEECPLKCWSKD